MRRSYNAVFSVYNVRYYAVIEFYVITGIETYSPASENASRAAFINTVRGLYGIESP